MPMVETGRDEPPGGKRGEAEAEAGWGRPWAPALSFRGLAAVLAEPSPGKRFPDKGVGFTTELISKLIN
jgi:hypothetical protein